jgi:hypothetical protein
LESVGGRETSAATLRTYIPPYAQTVPPRRGRRVLLEQFNTKIPSEVREMVEHLVEHEGENRQDIVARAIVELYERTFPDR